MIQNNIRTVSFKNIFRCWRKNHLLNNPEGTFLGKSCPYKKFNRPTEGSSMKCLHFICPQQWGQIDGPFWSLRHFGYPCECFRWLSRGGPYPRGSVRVRFHSHFSYPSKLFSQMNVHFSYFLTIMYFWEANQRRLSLVTEKNHCRSAVNCRASGSI